MPRGLVDGHEVVERPVEVSDLVDGADDAGLDLRPVDLEARERRRGLQRLDLRREPDEAEAVAVEVAGLGLGDELVDDGEHLVVRVLALDVAHEDLPLEAALGLGAEHRRRRRLHLLPAS